MENSKGAEDEEEDEPLDWDQAQVRVEIIPNKQPYIYALDGLTGSCRAYGRNERTCRYTT